MLTATDLRGLLNQRFFSNFLPIPATSSLRLGQPTPGFNLVDVRNRRRIKLTDYQGDRPVVLAFTRIFSEKYYCPFCFPHIKVMNERYEEFSQRGAELLLITSTDERQSQMVVQDLGLRLPLLSDPDCAVFRAYQTGQALGAPLPAQFVLDVQGNLQFRHLFSFLEPNASVDTLLTVLDQMPPRAWVLPA